MKAFKYHILGILITLFSISLSAQSITVNGKVTGIDGALAKVKISVVNSNYTATTNTQGDFTILVPNENSQITFKHKGASQTITLENGTLASDIFLLPNEKKLYKSISKREELRLCDIYLKYYPNEINTSQVEAIKEKSFFIEAYNIAAAKFSDTALRNYLKVYPKGMYIEKANDAIEIASWQNARFNNTAESYENYLNAYPKGKAAEMAKQKIAELNK